MVRSEYLNLRSKSKSINAAECEERDLGMNAGSVEVFYRCNRRLLGARIHTEQDV